MLTPGVKAPSRIFSFLTVTDLQMVRYGQTREDGQALVPHAEDGTDGLREGDVEGVQVLRASGIIESQ